MDDGQLRLKTFKNLLQLLPKGRLLDLGTGHGKFAIIGHSLGWDVTAVDARTERMPNSPGIRWVQSDVRAFEVTGYDCIALLGLLYHLDDPFALLARCAKTVTILDTHVAHTATANHLGYAGSFFAENVSAPAAAWINHRSFWPTKPELYRMLHQAGYETVMEVFPPHPNHRSFYVCCPAKP